MDTNRIVDNDDGEDEPVVVAGANHVLEAMSYHLSPEKFVPLVVSFILEKKKFLFVEINFYRSHKLNQCYKVALQMNVKLLIMFFRV
jgi:hypothetical protein